MEKSGGKCNCIDSTIMAIPLAGYIQVLQFQVVSYVMVIIARCLAA